MKNRNNKLVKRSLVLLGVIMILVNTNGVMASDYKEHEVKIKYLDKAFVDNYDIVVQDNKCHLINTDTTIKANGKNKNGLVDVYICNRKSVSKKSVAHSYKLKYVGYVDKGFILRGKVNRNSNSINLNIKHIRTNGKIIREYNLKINKRNMKTIRNVDIREVNKCGRYLYYILSCGNDEKTFYYYQKYDIKNNKLIFSTELKGNGHRTYEIEKSYLYVYSNDDNSITRYGNDGKMKGIYYLPEGEQFISYDNNGYSDMLRRYAYTINGNKIYYCNRNGVYKCDTDSGDSFELMYDAGKDKLFNADKNTDFDIIDMKVMDNESFYLFTASNHPTISAISKVWYYNIVR